MSEDQAPASEVAPVAGPFAALLALQDQDLHASQLRYRLAHLPERAELVDAETRLAAHDAAAAELSRRLGELVTRRDGLELEAEQLTGRIHQIEQRVASGGAASYRDQEAMAGEVATLGRRRGVLEDEELELMEAIEPLESELAQAAEQRQPLAAALEVATERLAAAKAAGEAALTEVEAGRAELVAAVAPALLAEYQRLAPRLDGVAVARLVRGACDGCHLLQPATELDRMRHAPSGSIFHCDQCGRILVPAAREPTAS